MIPAEFAAIEARANAATEGPWGIEADPDSEYGIPVIVRDEPLFLCGDCGVEGGTDRAEAEFIAHSRTDVETLLAAVRERDNTIARVRAELARREEYLPAAVDYDCCGYCNYTTGSYIAWPCPTYVHLRAALDPQETPDGRM